MATTVSTVTKVRDGRHTFQFDLSDNKLVIEYHYGKAENLSQRITIGSFPTNELKKLLNGSQPSPALELPAERPPDGLPKEGLQGRETDDGLIQTGDGIESGMD